MSLTSFARTVIALLLAAPTCLAQGAGDDATPHARSRHYDATVFAPAPQPQVPRPDDRILDPGDGGGLLVGPFGGVDYNMHSGIFSTTDGRFICCTADDGSGLGLVLGGKAFIPIADAFTISPRLLYEGRGGTFDGTPDSMLIYGQNQQPEMIRIAKQFEASLGTIGLDALVTYTVTDFGLYFGVGPSASYIVSKDFVQTSTITSPTGAVFLNGSTSQEVFHGDLDIVEKFQMAIRGGVGATIKIGADMYLNPEVLYGVPLTNFSRDNEWKGSVIQGTLGLMFEL